MANIKLEINFAGSAEELVKIVQSLNAGSYQSDTLFDDEEDNSALAAPTAEELFNEAIEEK